MRSAEQALDEAVLGNVSYSGRLFPSRVATILRYNDQPSRLKRDILAVYDQAIASS